MVEPVSFGLSKSGLQRSSSKNNLASMMGGNRPAPNGLGPQASPKKEAAAPTLLKRSRSMGTFGPYINFGQQAVEEISGKTSIGSSTAQDPPAGPVATSGSTTAITSESTSGSAATPVTSNVTPLEPAHSVAAPTSSDVRSSTSPEPEQEVPLQRSSSNEDTPELVDDNNLHHVPMARVDYFSHEWNESDLAGSWRYIVSRRQDMANSARLENASWRTWAKAKYKLKTVRPETVNWLKDYDVTWLYGPLYHERSSTDWDKAEPTEPVVAHKGKKADSIKSILKKKTIAEIMLEDTPDYQGPTDNYLRHHNYRQITNDDSNIARVVNSQYSRPHQEEEPEDRHVHFNARVEQCIALDPEEQEQPATIGPAADLSDSDSDSEEGGLFLGIQRSSNSNLANSRTIAPLPATTLNLPDDEDLDEPEPRNIQQPSHSNSRNYDYGSVYTCSEPAFKIVDPKVHAVAVPSSVQSTLEASASSVLPQSSGSRGQPVASFGCSK